MFAELIQSPWQWVLLALCAVVIGLSKTGIQGLGTLAVPVLALLFGGKPSTGIILPMLCMADVIAVIHYRRSAEWGYILKLLPTAIAGFFLALAVDSFVPESQFKRLMALCVFAGLIVMYWSEKRGTEGRLVGKWWFGALFGLMGGFTTMIGNAAGPIMAVYMLSARLPKYAFVGTSAWFFLIVNWLKLPLQIFAWHNISWNTVALDLLLLPCIGIGAWLGIGLVRRLPERSYRTVIIWLTVVTTAVLLF